MKNYDSDTITFIPTKEDAFTHSYGKNNGWRLLIHKIANCILLSAGAKELYNTTHSFCYNGTNICNPGRELLCDMLSIERNTLSYRLKELVDGGLLIVHRNFQSDSSYEFNEPRHSQILYHSELIYTDVHPKLKGKEFRSKLEKYMKSELFESIKTIEDVYEKRDEIKNWFFGTEKGQTDEVSNKRAPKIPPPMTSKESGREETQRPVRVKAMPYCNKTTDTWNLQDFKDYFKVLYEETFKLPLPPIGEKTVNSLTTIIRIIKDKNLVKEYMDIFIENSSKFKDASLAVFCWNTSQASLAHYKNTGEFLDTDYNKSNNKKEKQYEIPEDDEYAIALNNARKERLDE